MTDGYGDLVPREHVLLKLGPRGVLCSCGTRTRNWLEHLADSTRPTSTAPTPEARALGLALRDLRVSAGVSVRELAAAAGVSRWFMRDIESGRSPAPAAYSARVAAALASHLAMRVEKDGCQTAPRKQSMSAA